MKTVPIIEDDRAVAATYRHKFKEAGFRVEIAPDGVEGVKLVATLRPDAVVLDLLMPRLDGIEVLKFIRGHAEICATPVVVFSNSYMTNLVESAWRAGADECLMKASTMPEQLLSTVNKIIARNARRSPPTAAPAQKPIAVLTTPISPLGFSIPGHVLAGTPPTPTPAAASTNIVFEPPAPAPPAGGKPSPQADRFTIIYEEPSADPRQPGSGTSFFKNTPGTSFFVAGTRLVAEPDTEFHAQIRELFLNSSAARLDTIRELAFAFAQATDATLRAQQLDTLFRKIHALSGNAGLAGCTAIAHFTSTFEVLLKEIRDQPSWLNGSTLNTIARSVQALEGMILNPEELEASELPHHAALVIEADSPSADAAAAALEAARFHTTITQDPVYAIGLLATTDYDLVVTGIHLQDMTGFELLTQMESLPRHAHTPVIFATTHDNFASYLLDELVARHDLLAKPFPPIELTLKSLARTYRQKLQP